MLGGHTIKTWSKRQHLVALSSGEAELYALTRAMSQTLGIVSLAADFGVGRVSGVLRYGFHSCDGYDLPCSPGQGLPHPSTILLAQGKGGGQIAESREGGGP